MDAGDTLILPDLHCPHLLFGCALLNAQVSRKETRRELQVCISSIVKNLSERVGLSTLDYITEMIAAKRKALSGHAMIRAPAESRQ